MIFRWNNSTDMNDSQKIMCVKSDSNEPLETVMKTFVNRKRRCHGGPDKYKSNNRIVCARTKHCVVSSKSICYKKIHIYI